MSEPMDANYIEHLLEHGLTPTVQNQNQRADWQTQHRIDLLLRHHLDDGEERTFAAIMATLSPVRRERIASSIARRTSRIRRTIRRPSRAWPIAAMVLVGVGLAWMAVCQSAIVPVPSARTGIELVGPVGDVELERAGHQLVAVVGMGLQPGDILTTRVMGTVITYDDGSMVSIDDGVRLTVVPDAGKHLRLDAGCLTATIMHQSGLPLRIDTPHAQAVVVGTIFRLAVNHDGTHLDVSEGRVRLISTGGSMVEVDAGRQALATINQATVLLPTATGEGSLRLVNECNDAMDWEPDATRPFISATISADKPYSGDRCLRLDYRFPGRSSSSPRTRSYRFLPLAMASGDTAIRFALRCEKAQPRTDRILCVKTMPDGAIWRLQEEYFLPDNQWHLVTLSIPGRNQPPYRLEGHGTWDPARITALAVGCNEGDAIFCIDAVMVVGRP